MTQDEIIEMAKQTGLWFVTNREDLLIDFAKLVADAATAKEREACANLMLNLDLCGEEWKAAEAIRARGETTLRGEAT